jgi:hypothetical protein
MDNSFTMLVHSICVYGDVAYGFVGHLNELKNNIVLYYCVISVEKLVGFNGFI